MRFFASSSKTAALPFKSGLLHPDSGARFYWFAGYGLALLRRLFSDTPI
jgi:hypothetical protein